MKHNVLVPVSHPLGGIRSYIIYCFKRLHAEGARFTFLSEAGPAFESFKRDVADWQGTEFIDTPTAGGSKGAFFTIRKAIKERKFTLIHSQGLRSGTEAGAANYFRQIPHFVTLHDVIVPMNDIPGRFRTLKRLAISQLVRHASVLIPVSHDCAENHLEHFPAWRRGPARMETILNGIDIHRLDAADDVAYRSPGLRETFGVPIGAALGGFFGRFMPQKGFDLILDALAVLVRRGYGDRFRLLATKDPNGFLNETIRDATQNPDIGRMVYFIEPVSNVAPLLRQCDLLVMPSRWEACGLLAMEAMVLDTPVVGTDCLGLREVLRDTPSLVAEKENAESLAEKLIEFIEHPTTEAARNYVAEARNRFDVRRTTDALLELYRRYE